MSNDTEIVVEINYEDIIAVKYPVMIESLIIQKLKEAGIPVNGVLLFQGVKSGILSQEENIMNRSYIFRWKP